MIDLRERVISLVQIVCGMTFSPLTFLILLYAMYIVICRVKLSGMLTILLDIVYVLALAHCVFKALRIWRLMMLKEVAINSHRVAKHVCLL